MIKINFIIKVNNNNNNSHNKHCKPMYLIYFL